MTALDLDDLRKLARGAADWARNVTLSPFTILALIERVERGEAALARVSALADEWGRLPDGVVIDVACEVLEPLDRALGGDA